MYSNFKKSTSIVAPFYPWDIDLKLFKFQLHGDDSIQVTAFFWSISFSDEEFKRDFLICFYVKVDPPTTLWPNPSPCDHDLNNRVHAYSLPDDASTWLTAFLDDRFVIRRFLKKKKFNDFLLSPSEIMCGLSF